MDAKAGAEANADVCVDAVVGADEDAGMGAEADADTGARMQTQMWM